MTILIILAMYSSWVLCGVVAAAVSVVTEQGCPVRTFLLGFAFGVRLPSANCVGLHAGRSRGIEPWPFATPRGGGCGPVFAIRAGLLQVFDEPPADACPQGRGPRAGPAGIWHRRATKCKPCGSPGKSTCQAEYGYEYDWDRDTR